MKKLVFALIAAMMLSGCSSSTLRMIADGSRPMAFAPMVGGIFSVTGLVATIAADKAAEEELQAKPDTSPHVRFENMSTMKQKLMERRMANQAEQ